MNKRKICVVITARPSYSRIKSVLTAISEHIDLELQLVIAASALLDRYGTTIDYIEKDGFNVTAKVYNVLEGENLTSMAKTTGMGIIETSTVFDNIKPDVVITVADRFETMATAIAASYMNIPLAHFQGGEITGNIDEKVRHSISKLSDIHFVSSEIARERVIHLGEDPAYVFNTGCPSIDLAKDEICSKKLGFDPFELYKGVGKKFNFDQNYLVVMQHPVTTEHGVSILQVYETLEAIKELSMPTFWFWPNIDAGADGTSKGIRIFREANPTLPIYYFKNMEPHHFLNLIHHSSCLIGNSSVGIRESAFLGIPVVNIGSRQNGRDRSNNVIDTIHDKNEIVNSIRKQLDNGHYISDTIYGDGHAGQKAADILAKVKLRIDKQLKFIQ